jgi:hypothetical protein
MPSASGGVMYPSTNGKVILPFGTPRTAILWHSVAFRGIIKQ